MNLANAAQMRNLDHLASAELGIPGLLLMENAGAATVRAMASHLGELRGREFWIFAGPGNNGGDGLVVARHLQQLGGRPSVFLLVEPAALSGDAAMNLVLVAPLPIPCRSLATVEEVEGLAGSLGQETIIVDALFGTGLKRPLSGRFAAAVRLINESGRPVVAVDLPSGVDSDSGRILGEAVRATLTVTFALAKPGLFLYPGAELAGALEVADIGIPPQLLARAGLRLELLEKERLATYLPRRSATAHKGSFGHLLLVAGSRGKTGAALLCGQGALRSGAGLLTFAAPRDLQLVFALGLPEAMSVALPESRSCFLARDYPALAEALMGKQALVVGPGLGMAAATAALVEKLYRETAAAMVIDADGLNHLAAVRDTLSPAPGVRVLTPHPGEMARLCGESVAAIQADRLGAAEALAKRLGAVVVLKGAGTVIAAPDGRLAINPSGNPGMASGGMGDVLAGAIGGLLAQGLPAWEAACLGVYVHGRAGDLLLAKSGGAFGFLASELARELPAAFGELGGREDNISKGSE